MEPCGLAWSRVFLSFWRQSIDPSPVPRQPSSCATCSTQATLRSHDTTVKPLLQTHENRYSCSPSSIQVTLYYWPPLLLVLVISVAVGLYHTYALPRGFAPQRSFSLFTFLPIWHPEPPAPCLKCTASACRNWRATLATLSCLLAECAGALCERTHVLPRSWPNVTDRDFISPFELMSFVLSLLLAGPPYLSPLYNSLRAKHV